MESFFLFFPFLYRAFCNKYINWVAGGSFAVYIIQVTDPVCGKLFALDQLALESLHYTQYLPMMLFFCVFFFCACLIYNEIIQRLFSPVMKPIGNRIEYLILKLVYNDK